MATISFYHTAVDSLERSACKLLEKCYESNTKVLVRSCDILAMESLNRSLWTFAQKSFIPHGDANDKIENDQLIYITYKDENPINAGNLMLVDTLDYIYEDFDKKFVVFSNKIVDQVKYCFNKLNTRNNNISYYHQNSKGVWQKIEKTL